jgi:hypothetical protein
MESISKVFQVLTSGGLWFYVRDAFSYTEFMQEYNQGRIVVAKAKRL